MITELLPIAAYLRNRATAADIEKYFDYSQKYLVHDGSVQSPSELGHRDNGGQVAVSHM